jgi:hypothetical protein
MQLANRSRIARLCGASAAAEPSLRPAPAIPPSIEIRESSFFGADLGGLAGADKHCQELEATGGEAPFYYFVADPSRCFMKARQGIIYPA